MSINCSISDIAVVYKNSSCKQYLEIKFIWYLSVGATSCDVVLTSNGQSRTLSGGYSYDQTKTAVVQGLSPSQGGTGGGTDVTITGTQFGT
jgi:hypothetical protein